MGHLRAEVILSDKNEGGVFTGHTRSDEQEKVYREIEKEGVCPFCPENFRWHTKPILWESDWWIVTHNMEPYEGAKYHFLLILKQVCTNRPGTIPTQARVDFFDQVERLQNEFKFEGGAIIMRCYDMTWNGGSVDHLHAHVVVGATQHSESAKRIRVKVGYYGDVSPE